jgi:hypothetical protein
MTRVQETPSAPLSEIHDLYQRRIAAELASFVHIDLTIPAQAQVAERVMNRLSSVLDTLSQSKII